MRRLLAVIPLAVVLSGCNSFTGADDLEISPGEYFGNGSDPLAPEGVTIREVAIYQGVKRPLAESGVPWASATPVVAGRDALLRVFVSVDEKHVGARVTAKLTLGERAPVSQSLTVTAASTDDDLASTFAFQIDGADLAPGLDYRVELEGAAATSALRRFPLSGRSIAMPVTIGTDRLRVEVVPIRYDADGSKRLPDTSAAALAAYQRAFEAVYPVPRVEITVGAPFVYSKPVAAEDGEAWSDLLNAFAERRYADDPPDDVYYFGAFAPTETSHGYCATQCLEGLGFVVTSASDAADRVAIGLGFTDTLGRVAPHEVGHEHGRRHSPCGVTVDVDPSYPYENGVIGAWGYDAASGDLISPESATDLMGYCDPAWISDYTFAGIFQRTIVVSALESIKGGAKKATPIRYERARLGADGTLTSLPPVILRHPPGESPHRVEIDTASGRVVTSAHLVAYDHAAGGVLFWPAPLSATRAARVTLEGRTLEVTR